MSTNAIIQVEGITYAELYKHWDGYPAATLEWLEAFNLRFAQHRGDDPAYKFAQLLRDSVRAESDYFLDPSEFTGWGVNRFGKSHGEYKYILKGDGSVETFVTKYASGPVRIHPNYPASDLLTELRNMGL